MVSKQIESNICEHADYTEPLHENDDDLRDYR